MQWWLVRELGYNWFSLLEQTAMSVLYPVRTRLRRTMVLGEAARSKLPWTRLESIVDGALADTEAVTLKAVLAAQHNCSIHELATLAVIAKWVRPSKVLEIGTYDGRSALAIAANMPEGSELWTLNLPPDHGKDDKDSLKYDEKLAFKVESGFRFHAMPEASRIHQVFADSTKFDYAGMGPFQFVFIDGGHEETVVRKDTENVLRLVDRSRAVILWHDATKYGVRPALEKLRAQGHPISLVLGTTLAVMRFVDGKATEFPY